MPDREGRKRRPGDDMEGIHSELNEVLLPKLFDDVFSKNWRDVNSNIDLKIALEFLGASLEHMYGRYKEKLQVSYLLTAQK